jgi:hypothetical protein
MTAALSETPLASAFPSDQTLTEQELELARLFLAQTQNAVIGATKGLSEAQWNFRPAPDRWSIAENLGHVVMVQERVLGPILGQLANAPAPPADRDYAQVDAIVINQFSVRLNKASAPEFLRPADQTAPLALLDRLKANCIALLGHLELTPGLRRHAIEARPMKVVSKGVHQVMDGYQWILTTAAHTERHCKQMLEVMADPGYPVR